MAITTNVANLIITRGDTLVHRITVKNTDETAKDITGATVRYTVRERTYDGIQVLQKPVGSEKCVKNSGSYGCKAFKILVWIVIFSSLVLCFALLGSRS